jgi:hypothetical protein
VTRRTSRFVTVPSIGITARGRESFEGHEGDPAHWTHVMEM